MSLQPRLPRATKIELLRLKRRLRLAEKLRDLLHDRMTVLLQELYATALRATRLRRRLNELLQEAYPSFAEAYSTRGEACLEAAAMSAPEPKVRVMTRSSMGVTLPLAELENAGVALEVSIVELSKLYSMRAEILEVLVELSEAEKSLKTLATEIQKTRRKVEALDKILIPRLKTLIRSLTIKFEEIEREERVRSIKIKRMLESKHGEYSL
ncbi:MAG: V-type ATP synthase subunit D [Acidilobaceae archaeon]